MGISIAHCDGAVVAALATGRDVGIDAVRAREGATEAWIEGSSRYFAVSEPAVHSALVVAVAVAQD